MLKSAMAEDVVLAPDLCSFDTISTVQHTYNAVLEHTKLPFTPTDRNARLSPVSCYGAKPQGLGCSSKRKL